MYPIILAWTWGQGWLYSWGFLDFAGTGIVHLVGGVAGFWGALIVGARSHPDRAKPSVSSKIRKEIAKPNADYSEIAARYFKASSDDMVPNSNTFIVLGTMIVVTGYMFFTGGRTLTQFNPRESSPSKIIQNTLISCGFSGLVSFALKAIVMRRSSRAVKYDCLTLCNGILIGLISVSGVADRV